MRIAIVAHGLSNGGAERVSSLVANHFARVGHQVLFVAAYSPERVYPLDEAVAYVYINGDYKNKLRKGLSRSVDIDKAIRKFRADMAISFIISEMVVSSIRKTVPIVYSLRIDPARACSGKVNKKLCFSAYSRAAGIIFQTPDARDYFPEHIRKKGVVIPNPLTRNLPVWDCENSEKTIVTACRLSAQKNLPMLISAFAKFHEAHPDYTLRIYGDGPLLEEMKAFAKNCGVEKQVSFPGYAKNIHEIMAGSGIFALTSNYEGLSNSMLEALAIGVPTVCTDCPPGGAALYIEDGVSGMLVPVGDVEELTKRFCRMAEDRELCLSMSENARKIREVLDVDKVLKQWEAVLE